MSDEHDPLAWVEKAENDYILARAALCAHAGILIEFDAKRLNTLGDHAVRVRYPGADPSVEDARQALETAQAVRKFARKFLNVK